MRKLRIGSGAGYGGDRIEPAIDIINNGNLDYICFECLAERTIAIAAKEKNADQDRGYNELLEERFEEILPAMVGKRVKVITNMGAANPISAALKVLEIAKSKNLTGFKIAAVIGDDVFKVLSDYQEELIIETGKPLKNLENIITANAYCGVSGIVEALENGANIIITGRVSDPSLFLAPLVYEFGWSLDDYDLLGKGTCLGHLLECAAQITGGYFMDPGVKEVDDLFMLGFPIAEVYENGTFTITKLKTSGGLISLDTVKEQLLYEIQDPTKYFTPDVVADFSKVTLEQTAKDEVKVTGASGYAKTGLLKVNIGYQDGYIGEGEISYGGTCALERACVAGEIVEKRLQLRNLIIDELLIEYMGVNSLYKAELGGYLSEGKTPSEVRLRVAARCMRKKTADEIGNEVEALYLNGPAGGGGVRKYLREIVSVASILIPEERTKIEVMYWEV